MHRSKIITVSKLKSLEAAWLYFYQCIILFKNTFISQRIAASLWTIAKCDRSIAWDWNSFHIMHYYVLRWVCFSTSFDGC